MCTLSCLLLLLLLSRSSRVRLCATPQTAAHQAPPSLGFFRQEHCSGLPFPSPVQESEKWKKVAQSCPTLSDPWTGAYQAPPSMGFSRQEYWSGVPLPSPSVTNLPPKTLKYTLPQIMVLMVLKGEESKKGTLLPTSSQVTLEFSNIEISACLISQVRGQKENSREGRQDVSVL